MSKYKPRIADEILRRKLKSIGAVLIEGPKWCGKTTTAEQQAKSVIYINDPETYEENLNMANIKPKRLLIGDTPRLIDEWQLVPKLWDTIRFEVDHRENGIGQFILTGSSTPISKEDIKHSGTGRYAHINMRTMSLYESRDSTGEISLKDLFEQKESIDGSSNIDIEKLAFLVCRGGWPKSLDLEDDLALDQAYDYYNAVVKDDINRVDNIQKNSEAVSRFMRSYARNQGSQVPNTILADDAFVNEETIASYINSLNKMFVIEDLPAWNPNLRSKAAIRTSNTRYFVDPSIAVASLGVGPNDLLNDLKTFGFLFETLCVRDLRVYADSINGSLYHYRDKDGQEVDAVIHLRSGKYGLIEIKLGGDKLIEEGATSLKKMKDKIDTDKMNAPSFLMVLTGVGAYAYKREDGVLVIPIGCLKN